MFSTSNQAYVFLCTVYAGFLIGLIYDFCRIIRSIAKPGVWLTGMMDLLFWILIGVLSFLVIFRVNDGEVRIYTIVGFAVGWGLYVLTLSPYIRKALTWIFWALAKAIRWLITILLWPFRFLIRILGFPMRSAKRILSKGFHGIRKGMAVFSLKKRRKSKERKEEF